MKKTIWLLLDDRRGSVGQALGVAQALGDRLEIVEKKLVYNFWAVLPNWLRSRSLIGVDKTKSDDLSEEYPDIVMSISRRTVPVARYIRRKSGNKTKIVQLMYPSGGVGIKEMELVIVPAHDGLKKQQIANAMVILGAPTRICSETMAKAKKEWEKVFSDLPRPYTSIIIGGAIKGREWPLDNAEALADNLIKLYNKIGGSFFITTSRRTGEKAQNLIMEKIRDIPSYTYVWGEKKENPLMGFYACADKIVVTADSVSMCSEACGTGAPVLLFLGKNWLPQKHQLFAKSLIDNGFAKDLLDDEAVKFRPEKILHCAEDIADRIVDMVKD